VQLSDSDGSYPQLERTDSFYMNLIDRLKSIDYDMIHGFTSRSGTEGSNITSEGDQNNKFRMVPTTIAATATTKTIEKVTNQSKTFFFF
jgi:hypothetical protein